MKTPALRHFLTGLVMALAGSSLFAAASDQEIQYLLSFVADSGCIFIRNGNAHDSVDASDHLRLKYSKAKRHAASAEQFIDRLASESSWSGKPYTVDCDGRSKTSGAWLHQALADYRHSGGDVPLCRAEKAGSDDGSAGEPCH